MARADAVSTVAGTAPSLFRVGLTGGVGSGKSTVANLLAALGAGIIDADAISHELTAAGGAAIEALRHSFGDAAIDARGALDRTAMRARAFSDPAHRSRLESVLHPLIRTEATHRAATLRTQGAPYLVFVIPLLVESGDWSNRVDRVLVIDCSPAAQLARVSSRPGLDAASAERIVGAQASRAQRLAAADDVLFNEAPLAELEPRVRQLHETYLARARAHKSV
jgi:dephospho-CoA kinase